MSRSRRKTPVCGITTAKSERWDKTFWHRAFRVAQRIALGRGDEVLPLPKEIEYGTCGWGEKDGKQSFDPEEWPQIMRK